ncbi:MAG: RNA 2',3'-cyclic phosphodiesterase [Planctomycetota bacterium]
MRAFVALELPDEVRRAGAALGARLAEVAAVRPVPEGQLHLTLKFLGDIDERQGVQLGSALAAETWPSMRLQLRGLGQFPPRGAPHVVWAGVEGDLQRLSEVAGRVETLASAVGVPAETRPFRAHVTLGRCRSPRGALALGEMLRERAAGPLGPPFAAPAVALFRSDVGGEGAVHRALVRVPLPAP